MKGKLIWVLLLLTVSSGIYGQYVSFSLQSGLGKYHMSGLKSLNEMVPENIPFDTKKVADFPMYFYYRPSINFHFGNFIMGLNYTFQSTGSRISAKDYSGEYRFDMKVKTNAPGGHLEAVVSSNKLITSLYVAGAASFSKLKMIENFTVMDTTLTDDNYTFEAISFLVEPGISLKYPFRNYSIGLNAGYQFDITPETFYTDNNKEMKLYNSRSMDEIKPQWRGIRLGISLTYYLYRMPKPEVIYD